ncbi:MAG: tetratricopeptide repeat protein [Treponema sp.]|jgi:tetratricopeptide (TPR) repeat protein|nr:tetratricopeptide repeat protein [Treponema sp.]
MREAQQTAGLLIGAALAACLFCRPFPLSGQSPGVQNTNPAYWHDRGRAAMVAEDWYTAAESFIEALRFNPAHAEAAAALAECYYELGEFDESLLWVRKARVLARGSQALANLEAFILIALGRLDDAQKVIDEILSREPYNKEALFAAAELDIAGGRSGDAVVRYREAVRRFPDDRRLLISLALVLGSLGDTEGSRSYIERALLRHPEDYRVYYYAAYLAARGGRIRDAVDYALEALYYRPGYSPARSLLASLYYRSGNYEEAARLADELIALDREDSGAWFLKGMAYIRLGRGAEAVTVLSTALAVDPGDEFIRSTLEELLVSGTRVEDPRRSGWASWHFSRARDYRARSLIEQALFEYRRGLRLNPYARDRREYADLLRIQGYPARYLEELRFMQDLGLGDRTLNDAVESYDALLGDALFRRWGADPVGLSKPYWKVAVFSLASQSAFFHADAGAAGSAYIKDILVHERNIAPMDLELRQPSFSGAFRQAREGGADYFLIISVSENERDISIKGELFVARTGAPAAVFNAYRTGQDRLRYASRGIVDQLARALPFRACLIRRSQGRALIDKGRADGVKEGAVFEVVRKGGAGILNEGIGLAYTAGDVVGKITIEKADEEVSAGALARTGFFDRISEGDEIFQAPEENAAPPAATVPIDPELRRLLRTLR